MLDVAFVVLLSVKKSVPFAGFLFGFVICWVLYSSLTVVCFKRDFELFRKKQALFDYDLMTAWNSRIVSTVNAFFCCWAAYQMIFALDTRSVILSPHEAVFSSAYAVPGGEGGGPWWDCRAFYLPAFGGYLAYDLALCLGHSSLRESFTAMHHIVVLLAIVAAVRWDLCSAYVGALLVNEVSTPFLNARYFLWKLGLENSKAYFYNGLALYATFSICRVAWIFAIMLQIGWAWYEVGFHQAFVYTEPPARVVLAAVLTTLAFCHWAINVWWFKLLTKKVMETITQRKKEHKPVQHQATANCLSSTSAANIQQIGNEKSSQASVSCGGGGGERKSKSSDGGGELSSGSRSGTT